VKFAEVDRNVSRQFGVNLFSTGFGNTPAAIGTGQFGGSNLQKVTGSIPGTIPGFTTEMNLKDVLNIFAFRPDLNLGATVKALQAEGVLQILAEPNLVTTVGKEASFLVGGEFPIPVLQGGSGAAAVTIQFREFGIRLTFNPQMTENNTLKMYVKPEVSTIDLANAVTLNGFTIPALATRRMETNVELAQGQSFVIGGLIDDRVSETMSKVPGLSSIPVLGALFKSREEKKSKSELLVIVTPELIDPLNPGDPKPELNMPKDWLKPVPPKVQKQSSLAPKTPVDAKAELPVPEQQLITTHLTAANSNRPVADAPVAEPAPLPAPVNSLPPIEPIAALVPPPVETATPSRAPDLALDSPAPVVAPVAEPQSAPPTAPAADQGLTTETPAAQQ